MRDRSCRPDQAQLFVALVAAIAPLVGRLPAECREFAVEVLRREAGSGPRLVGDIALLIVAMANGRPAAQALAEAKDSFALPFYCARRHDCPASEDALASAAAAIKGLTWGGVVEEMLRAFLCGRLTASWLGDDLVLPFGVQFGVTNRMRYATFERGKVSGNDDGTRTRDVFTFGFPTDGAPYVLLTDRRVCVMAAVFQRAAEMMKRFDLEDGDDDLPAMSSVVPPVNAPRHKDVLS